MSAPDPSMGDWSIFYHQPWHDDSLNPRFPYALRVAFLAFGTHRANGHATFRRGEVAKVLSHVDDDGTLIPTTRQTVHRAIAQAVEFGMLEEGSHSMCLVVPRHRATGGRGSPNSPCGRHSDGRLRGVESP